MQASQSSKQPATAGSAGRPTIPNPWKHYKNVAHVECSIPGRHATDSELAQGSPFWIPGSHDVMDWDRAVRKHWHSLLGWRLNEIISSPIEFPLEDPGRPKPEPLNKEPALQDMLLKMGKTVRRVVVAGLGTLEKCPGKDFPDNLRSYLLVRQIVRSLMDMTHGETKHDQTETPTIKVFFEDAYYTDEDLRFLRNEFLIAPRTTSSVVTVEVDARRNGSGWKAAWPSDKATDWMADDWMFVTFNTKTPIRQVLAGYLDETDQPNPIPKDEKRRIKPRAIICRPEWDSDNDPNNETSDLTNDRVKGLLGSYYTLPVPLLEGDYKGLGSSVFHYLPPRAAGTGTS